MDYECEILGGDMLIDELNISPKLKRALRRPGRIWADVQKINKTKLIWAFPKGVLGQYDFDGVLAFEVAKEVLPFPFLRNKWCRLKDYGHMDVMGGVTVKLLVHAFDMYKLTVMVGIDAVYYDDINWGAITND